jgi:hypothetical protein
LRLLIKVPLQREVNIKLILVIKYTILKLSVRIICLIIISHPTTQNLKLIIIDLISKILSILIEVIALPESNLIGLIVSVLKKEVEAKDFNSTPKVIVCHIKVEANICKISKVWRDNICRLEDTNIKNLLDQII